MTPEEKLLRAIFGEKASDVRDTSLRVPPGGAGTVVEVRVFSRRGVDKDERARAIERFEIERLAKDRDDEKEILERGFYGRLKEMLTGQTVATGPKDAKAGTKLTEAVLEEMPRSSWSSIPSRMTRPRKPSKPRSTTLSSRSRALKPASRQGRQAPAR